MVAPSNLARAGGREMANPVPQIRQANTYGILKQGLGIHAIPWIDGTGDRFPIGTIGPHHSSSLEIFTGNSPAAHDLATRYKSAACSG